MEKSIDFTEISLVLQSHTSLSRFEDSLTLPYQFFLELEEALQIDKEFLLALTKTLENRYCFATAPNFSAESNRRASGA